MEGIYPCSYYYRADEGWGHISHAQFLIGSPTSLSVVSALLWGPSEKQSPLSEVIQLVRGVGSSLVQHWRYRMIGITSFPFPHLYMNKEVAVANNRTFLYSGPVHPCLSHQCQLYFASPGSSNVHLPKCFWWSEGGSALCLLSNYNLFYNL